jgi:hypothetical protein
MAEMPVDPMMAAIVRLPVFPARSALSIFQTDPFIPFYVFCNSCSTRTSFAAVRKS